jgi:hypothetical protein
MMEATAQIVTTISEAAVTITTMDIEVSQLATILLSK